MVTPPSAQKGLKHTCCLLVWLRGGLASAPKMTSFDYGAQWHHPLSTPHLFSHLPHSPQKRPFFRSIMMSVTEHKSPPQGSRSRCEVIQMLEDWQQAAEAFDGGVREGRVKGGEAARPCRGLRRRRCGLPTQGGVQLYTTSTSASPHQTWGLAPRPH